MERIKKHPLEEINWGVMGYTVYRGVIVERLVGGFCVFNKVVTTPQEVDKIIDESIEVIEKSIK